ncbi:MAG: trimethylamine methyltransferase family protein [Chloroflexota bacterium]
MINSNAVHHQTIQFSVLTESQKQAIHLAALEVLRRTGIRFYHTGALEMLKKAGAFISDGNLVKFPARIVEAALATAPCRVSMCDRDGQPAMHLEGNRAYFGTGSDCLNLLDPRTGEHRLFVESDLPEAYRLCDALPNISFVMSVGLPSDVDTQLTYDIQMLHMLENTVKPIVFVTNDRASCQRAIDMAAAVAGGYEALREHQHILLYSEPSSPLKQSETAVDKLILMAETELPVVHSPGPQMGAVAPITMAGGLVMSLAEIMSSLVVHQLTRPGAPFVFGAGIHHMDMSSMQICYASPEFQLTKAAVAELGRWYGLPTWGYAGCSDAKVMDEQAAAEAMLSVTMAQFSGGNLIHDVGYMESGLTCSYEMIVLTDELVAMTQNLVKGIQVNEDTLLVDEIDRVGPGGQYIATQTTLKHFREFWFPGLLDRKTRPTWLKKGGTDLGQRLNEKVQKILAEYKPKPLAEEKSKKLREILAAAKK